MLRSQREAVCCLADTEACHVQLYDGPFAAPPLLAHVVRKIYPRGQRRSAQQAILDAVDSLATLDAAEASASEQFE
eukprot:COSAG01_NODE_7420_length_3215_cov_1523.875802_4_plen_76_part_00